MKKESAFFKEYPFLLNLVLVLLISAVADCVPALWLPGVERADSKPEYRAKYFTVKPPKGRWIASVGSSEFSFRVPLEGDILNGISISEGIAFYSDQGIGPFGPMGGKWSPALTITSRGVGLSIPNLKEARIAGKTFYYWGEDYPLGGLWYLTPSRAYEFEVEVIRDGESWRIEDKELLKVIESFEPIDFTEPRKELLLEIALRYSRDHWRLALGPTAPDKGFRNFVPYDPTYSAQAFQDAIDEDPNSYIAHLFSGISHLAPKARFYDTVLAPQIKKPEDAKMVITDEMIKFDIYRLNEIWLVNKEDFYSYLLHGDFDDKAAMAEFKKALEIKPDSYAAKYLLSWLYLRNGEYEKAALEFSNILKDSPQDTDALLMKSVVCEKMGRKKEAKESLDALKKVSKKGTLYGSIEKQGTFSLHLVDRLLEALSRSIRR